MKNLFAYAAISAIALFGIFNIASAQTWDDSWDNGDSPNAEELANDDMRMDDADDNWDTQDADRVNTMNDDDMMDDDMMDDDMMNDDMDNQNMDMNDDDDMMDDDDMDDDMMNNTGVDTMNNDGMMNTTTTTTAAWTAGPTAPAMLPNTGASL